jgi:glycine hydroxymethyltransferase
VLGERLQEHGFSLVSGGTDTHLVLVDLRESHPDISGGDAEDALEEVGIVLNANTVPDETRSAFDPSGIRIGTPALTTRGFDADAMETVADCIASVIDNIDDDDGVSEEVAAEVDELTDRFPLYE